MTSIVSKLLTLTFPPHSLLVDLVFMHVKVLLQNVKMITTKLSLPSSMVYLKYKKYIAKLVCRRTNCLTERFPLIRFLVMYLFR